MTTLHPRLSKAAIELVKSFEGLRRTAARLPGGGWTIGYGHTLSAREGAEVTADQAEALLLYDLDKTARQVDVLVTTGMNANQFSALIAFAFNIGLENFRDSAVLRLVNAASFLQAAAAIELWRRADVGGDPVLVDGLVRRRAAEKALFLTPPEGFKPVSTPVLRAALDSQGDDLSAAADLWVSLDGPQASIEHSESPGAATTQAIRNVAARLHALFPDEDAAEAPPAIPGADALVEEPDLVEAIEQEPELEAPPAFEPEPEVEEELPPVAAPVPRVPELYVVNEPAPEPKAANESEPEPDRAPEVDAEPEPPPPPGEALELGSLGRAASVAQDDEPLFQSVRRSLPLATEKPATVKAPAEAGRGVTVPSVNAPVVLLVGLAGAVMFVGSLAAMVYGKATLSNLVIGLLGVICMAPAGLKLLMGWFGQQGPDQKA